MAWKRDVARPPNSECPCSMPVSRTYAVTPAPVPTVVKLPWGGCFFWTIRSRPQAEVCPGQRLRRVRSRTSTR
jgi:hypothetical protein